MKHLYYAEDNAYNYIFVRDMDKDENDTLIVNWDLSEDEVDEIVKAFEANEDDTSFYAIEEENWSPFEEVVGSMNGYHHLA